MSGGLPYGMSICGGTIVAANEAISAGTQVAPSSSANTKGTYVQLIAATTYDFDYLSVGVGRGSGSTGPFLLDIAIGAAGSEKIIINNIVTGVFNPTGNIGNICLPLDIPAGTRVAARSQSATAADGGASVAISGYQSNQTGMEGVAGVDCLGAVTGSSVGTTFTAGSANVKGSYAAYIAATVRDYCGFFVCFDRNTTASGWDSCLWDIAVGASGQEKIIVPDHWMFSNANDFAFPVYSGPFWIPIPAGQRLAARLESETASITVNSSILAMYL